jgi:hypothetical protein
MNCVDLGQVRLMLKTILYQEYALKRKYINSGALSGAGRASGRKRMTDTAPIVFDSKRSDADAPAAPQPLRDQALVERLWREILAKGR